MRSCFFFILMTAYLPAHSQFRAGFFGGANYTSLETYISSSSVPSTYDYDYFTPKWGYAGGILGEMDINAKFRARASLQYAKYKFQYFKHTSAFSGLPPINKFGNYDFQQAKLQLHIIYGLPLGSGRISIGAGGVIARPLSKKIGYKLICFPEGQNCHDINTVYSDNNTSLIPAVSGLINYEFSFGASVEIQYEYAYNMHKSNKNVYPKTENNMSANIFSFGIGYYIVKTKK